MTHRFLFGVLLVMSRMAAVDAITIDDYSGVVVIGDSLSDGGNAVALTGATVSPPFGGLVPPAPYAVSARLSNGPVWSDNVGLTASLLGGTNYAFGGARTGPLPVAPVPGALPTLLEQVAMLFADTGPSLPNDALYVVAGGGNDVRDAAGAFARAFDETLLRSSGDRAAAEAAGNSAAGAVIAASIANIADITSMLAGAGAERLLVWNTPDLGVAPAATALGPERVALLGGLSVAYNVALAGALDLTASTFSGLDLVEFDLFALVNAVVSNPLAFGLTDATGSCVTPSAVCADADAFLFWDGLHPTTAGHRIIGERIAAQVETPAPGTLALALAGLCLVLVLRRDPLCP